MAKYQHNDILDAALNVIKNNANKMTLCSAAPTTYTQATDTYLLAEVAMTSTDFTGPADWSTGGRKLTVGAKSPTAAASSAEPDLHVALVDTANEKLLFVTDEITDQAITEGNPCNIPTWEIKLADVV